MRQTWNTLLFAHWPVSPAMLAGHVPSELSLDTFDGDAWIAVTPFVLSDLRARATPALPSVSEFPEINVRTYVQRDGKGGVFFFSLDAGSTLAVKAARTLYGLPYHRADFEVTHDGPRTRYVCRRRGSDPGARFEAEYEPAGPAAASPAGSLAAWLTERYCLYTVDARRRIHRTEIHHVPWPLQPAAATIRVNTMAAASRLTLPDRAPLLHFARRLDVWVWLPAPVMPSASQP